MKATSSHIAQISNPVLDGGLLETNAQAATSGQSFARYFLHLWNAIVVVGAIAVLVFFLWGAIEWITSAGDKGKLENARNRITQSMLGLIILVGSYTIISFVSQLFFGDGFNILQPKLPSAL